MMGRDDGVYADPAQPWTYGSDHPIDFQTSDLARLCEKLVSEHTDLVEKNSQLKRAIEAKERECFLLSHPQFLDTELHKVQLEIDTYLAALRDVETHAAATLAAMRSRKE